jgi:hypothetical protein
MLNFILKLVLGIAGLVGLIFFIRYSLTMLSGFDKFFTKRYRHTSRGLRWGIRLPTKVGEVVEFYFYVILGKKNYMNYSSWPIKITLIISMFLFLAILTSWSFVANYYTFQLGYYYEGGSILWYLHLITLAYLSVIVLVSVDSIKMMGYFAPLRILYFGVVMVASIGASVLSFSLFIAFSFFYLIIKILGFFFRSRRRYRYEKERKPSLLARHYARFMEVHDVFDHPDIVNKDTYTETRPQKEKRYYDDDIKKVYSD